MAVRVITVPDGNGGYNEVYSTPVTAQDANAWLNRVGATHIKFGTSKGTAVLKDAATGAVYLQAAKISDLCYFLAFNPPWMMRLKINGYDWYRPNEAWNSIGTVNILL